MLITLLSALLSSGGNNLDDQLARLQPSKYVEVASTLLPRDPVNIVFAGKSSLFAVLIMPYELIQLRLPRMGRMSNISISSPVIAACDGGKSIVLPEPRAVVHADTLARDYDLRTASVWNTPFSESPFPRVPRGFGSGMSSAILWTIVLSKFIVAYDLSTEKRLCRVEVAPYPPPPVRVFFSVSANGRRAVAWFRDDDVLVLCDVSGENVAERGRVAQHPGRIQFAAIDTNGEGVLAVARNELEVDPFSDVLGNRSGTDSLVLTSFNSPLTDERAIKVPHEVTAVAQGASGNAFVIGDVAGQIAFLDGKRGTESLRWQAHRAPVIALAAHRSSGFVASADTSGTVKLWRDSSKDDSY